MRGRSASAALLLAIKTMSEQIQARKGAPEENPAETEDVEEAPEAAETPTGEVTEPPAEQSK
jgi:hypothetical protein